MSNRTLFLLTALLYASSGWSATDAQVERAIARGVHYLRSAQEEDGGWSFASYSEGSTSLAGLALLESGVKGEDPSILRAAHLLRSRAASITKTYSLAVAILFFDRLGNRDDIRLISELGQRLRNGQNEDGGWSYECRPGRGGNSRELSLLGVVANYSSDNSNTQFAVLGLWAARRHGVDVKQALERTDKYFRQTQVADGGWPYMTIYVQLDPAGGGRGQPTGDSSGAMTCAGLLGLLVQIGNRAELRAGSVKDLKAAGATKTATPTSPLEDRAVQAAFRRLGHFLGPQGDANRLGNGTELYFLWSIERVAVAYGLNTIGPVDWYTAGANRIVASQQADGSWPDHAANVGTSFALLFLRRANLTSDLTRLIGGQTELRTVDDSIGKPGIDHPAPDNAASKTLTLAELPPDRLAERLTTVNRKQQSLILEELRDRKGSAATMALADSIGKLAEPLDAAARKHLAERLERMTPGTLVQYLELNNDEIRLAAALAARSKNDRALIAPLIELLSAHNIQVADAAHSALQAITGQRFGNFVGQNSVDRYAVAKKWRTWWTAQDKPSPQ